MFGFLFQGTTAMRLPRGEETLQQRQVNGNVVAIADRLVGHYNTQVPNSDLGETLVRGLLDIGCDLMESGQGSAAVTDLGLAKTFAVDFTTACRTALTDLPIANSLEMRQNTGTALLLSLDASLLCNLMLGSFFHANELVKGICDYTKPCSEDLSSDPNNCGRCGNVVRILPRYLTYLEWLANLGEVPNRNLRELGLP